MRVYLHAYLWERSYNEFGIWAVGGCRMLMYLFEEQILYRGRGLLGRLNEGFEIISSERKRNAMVEVRPIYPFHLGNPGSQLAPPRKPTCKRGHYCDGGSALSSW